MADNKENLQEEQQEEIKNEAAAQEQSEETATAENTEEAQAEEVDPVAAEISSLKAQVDTLNDKYLRLSAEYDNYRKRTIKEKADMLKSAGSDVLAGLLPVLDDFERALAHMTDASDVESLRTGVELIHKKFIDFLGKKGVAEIPAKGEPFDAEVHEAITMMPAPSEDMKGKCFDCVEKGYKMGDKVIRFAKVVVCE
ncbi:MAG: nucleotide exchange factor GrpE [Bacteroidales bacterium]|nr:nucleotide exchange factor GrpE [Bacteroidales bacterium]